MCRTESTGILSESPAAVAKGTLATGMRNGHTSNLMILRTTDKVCVTGLDSIGNSQGTDTDGTDESGIHLPTDLTLTSVRVGTSDSALSR